MKTDPPLEKITTRLYKGDMARMQTLYSRTLGGASTAIRLLVHKHLEEKSKRVDLKEIGLL